MRPGDEGAVAEEHHPTVGDARRLEVEDRLEKGLRALDDRRELRRKQFMGIALQPRSDLRPDQGWRDRVSVAVAARVGAQVGELALGRGSIPDEVPFAGRHRIGEHHLALRQSEVIVLGELDPRHRAAPAHIAGVARLHLRQELRAQRRAQAVRRDQKIACHLDAILEARHDLRIGLVRTGEIASGMEVRAIDERPQRLIDARPMRHHLRQGAACHHASIATEADAVPDQHTEPLAGVDAQGAQALEQHLVRAEPGAAAREIVGGALIDMSLPADALQEGGGKEPAHRAADHGGAPPGNGHLITWSARSKTELGILRPSASAVFKLIINSSLVGCSIGKSPGFAPLFKTFSADWLKGIKLKKCYHTHRCYADGVRALGEHFNAFTLEKITAERIEEFRNNKGKVEGMFKGMPMVILTTKGRRSCPGDGR